MTHEMCKMAIWFAGQLAEAEAKLELENSSKMDDLAAGMVKQLKTTEGVRVLPSVMSTGKAVGGEAVLSSMLPKTEEERAKLVRSWNLSVRDHDFHESVLQEAVEKKRAEQLASLKEAQKMEQKVQRELKKSISSRASKAKKVLDESASSSSMSTAEEISPVSRLLDEADNAKKEKKRKDYLEKLQKIENEKQYIRSLAFVTTNAEGELELPPAPSTSTDIEMVEQ